MFFDVSKDSSTLTVSLGAVVLEVEVEVITKGLFLLSRLLDKLSSTGSTFIVLVSSRRTVIFDSVTY
ncbi:5365_t:CDS:1, partial [Funneliformis caledonium]